MDKPVTKRELIEVLAAHRAETKADLDKLRAETKADLTAHRAATKADIAELRAEQKADIQGVESRMATKADLSELRLDLKQTEYRLSSKIDANHKANVGHHLATRKEIGQLNKNHFKLKAGLASAAK